MGKTRSKSERAKDRFHVFYFTNPSGSTAFRVAGNKPDGTRVRENFGNYKEALWRKAELELEAAGIVMPVRMVWTHLTDDQLRDGECATARLRELQKKFPSLAGKTLVDVVKWVIANKPPCE